jgi:hypothetical protein
MVNLSTDYMLSGAEVLSPLLTRYGLEFKIISQGTSSGGLYCEAAFSDNVRMLELHFRTSLGLVTYHWNSEKVSHEIYMDSLGAAGASAYPGFSDKPLDCFHHLLLDLERFGDDFLSGEGHILRSAAKLEMYQTEQDNHQNMVLYVGDTRNRSQAREEFRLKNYPKVVTLLDSLEYPDDLSLAEQKMLELARNRSADS